MQCFIIAIGLLLGAIFANRKRMTAAYVALALAILIAVVAR